MNSKTWSPAISVRVALMVNGLQVNGTDEESVVRRKKVTVKWSSFGVAIVMVWFKFQE